MKNIFEKIQAIRVELLKKSLTMTGNNTYAGYKYFELEDFLAPLNELMNEYKITAIPSFSPEYATLTVVNIENLEEKVVITSPMGTATLKGCHEVQNIGAVETYQRRYLYQALFDISEKDSLNGTQGKPEEQKKQNNKPAQQSYSEKKQTTPNAQKQQEIPFPEVEQKSNTELVEQALKGTGWTIEVAERSAVKNFARSIEELNKTQLNQLISNIEGAKTNA